MRTLVNLLKAVENLNVREIALDSMGQTSQQFLKHQKDQLYAGFDSKGKRLHRYASSIYAEMKQRMNSTPGYGNPDLKLTGDFYRSFRADLDNEGLRISAWDEKAPMLEDKYGNDIYTLGEDAIKGYVGDLQPVFTGDIVDALNAK